VQKDLKNRSGDRDPVAFAEAATAPSSSTRSEKKRAQKGNPQDGGDEKDIKNRSYWLPNPTSTRASPKGPFDGKPEERVGKEGEPKKGRGMESASPVNKLFNPPGKRPYRGGSLRKKGSAGQKREGKEEGNMKNQQLSPSISSRGRRIFARKAR